MNVIDELNKKIDYLEGSFVELCVLCRNGDLKALPNQKAVVNFVHNYCAKVLEGEINE